MRSVMRSLKEQGEKLRENILNSIIEYISVHGYAPKIREIGEMTGLKSTYTVQHHMKVLLEEGKIETDAEFSSPRAIRVPGYKFQKVAE